MNPGDKIRRIRKGYKNTKKDEIYTCIYVLGNSVRIEEDPKIAYDKDAFEVVQTNENHIEINLI